MLPALSVTVCLWHGPGLRNGPRFGWRDSQQT